MNDDIDTNNNVKNIIYDIHDTILTTIFIMLTLTISVILRTIPIIFMT